MTDHRRHPDDAELFDLVEGHLDESRSTDLRRHLDRCAACSAFVTSARAATAVAAAGAAVEAMPTAAAERMHLRLSDAWRTQAAAAATGTASVADAAPAMTTDGVAMGNVTTLPLEPPARRPARAKRRFSRWAVPAVAFATLAALAGTSVFVIEDGAAPTNRSGAEQDSATSARSGAEDSTSSSNSEAELEAEFEAGEREGADDAAAGGDSATAGTPGTPGEPGDAGTAGDSSTSGTPGIAGTPGTAGTTSPNAVTAEPGLPQDEAAGPGSEGSETSKSAPSDQATPTSPSAPTAPGAPSVQETICVALDDEAQLVLPEDRSPTQMFTLPMGTIILCG